MRLVFFEFLLIVKATNIVKIHSRFFYLLISFPLVFYESFFRI